MSNYTEGIKIIVPEGLRDPISINTRVNSKFCIGNETHNCLHSYKVKVRAMATKMPGV